MRDLPDTPFYAGSLSKQKKKRILFVAIRITLALIAMMLVFLLSTLLVMSIISTVNAPQEEITDIGDTEKLPIADIPISNDLSQINGSTMAPAVSTLVNLESYEHRAKTRAGTNAFTVGNKPAFFVTAESVAALNQMIGDFYAATGDDNIYIANAYNSNDGAAQDSPYTLGTAFELKYFSAADISDWTKKDSIYGVELYSWIYENSYRYGFLAVTDLDGASAQNNIFRYVGVPHAQLIRENRLLLSTYFSWIKSYSEKKPLMGSEYAVYYQKPGESVAVPVNYMYTVYGNALDGYIITVSLY